MESPLPPDPYVALGVPKDTDTATIKSIYRKLVLKCHPDKFTDEDIKAQKVEEFHKIQQAYELLVDEEKRSRYDAQIRLCELRREALERGGSAGGSSRGGVRVEIRTNGYDVRTAAPSSSFSRGSTRGHAEKKPSRGYDEHDRYYEESRGSSRKDSYDYVRKSTKERERERKETDRSRADRKKEASKNKRKDHSAKYASVEEEDSDSLNRQRSEIEEQRRRMEEMENSRRYEREKYAAEAEEKRRRSDEERRRVESSPRRKEREYTDDVPKYQSHLNDAKDYIESYKQSQQPHHESRRSERPVEIRRSSARPRTNRNYSTTGRERGDRRGSYPEIVEFASDRKPPALRPSDSSPANIRPPRSHTFQSEHDPHADELAPRPMPFRRSETMPTGQGPPRRKDAVSSSKYQGGDGNRDSGYSSPSTPETQYQSSQHVPAATTRYVYSTNPTGIDDKYRTILREPERRVRTSPSPMRGRDREREMDYGSNPSVRVVPPTPSATRYTYSYPETPVSPHVTETRRPSAASRPMPGLSRSATMATPAGPENRASAEDRGRRPLFGEVVDGVSYSKKHDINDVNWAPPAAHHTDRRRGRTRDFDMPGMERGRPMMRKHETFAF